MQEQTKKACFIVPYFGTLPDYLDVFLRTCGENPDYDWLIIIDDHARHSYPDNVHVQYSSFETFRARIQAHFDFHIELPRPYKICDFRAAFGEIFAEELQMYRFWGHCDFDQYFGRISNFITEEILSSYEKILCLGHFTLFRNCPRINSMYRTQDRNYCQDYRDAFSDSLHWTFDEWPLEKRTSSNRIFKQEQVRTWLCPECFCDLKPFQSRFHRTLFDYTSESFRDDDIKNEIFVWERGKLLRCYMSGGLQQRQEILYVHVRQRKLDLSRYSGAGAHAFCIIPNCIISAETFSDAQILQLLKKAQHRALLIPDERNRLAVCFIGLIRAALRRIWKGCLGIPSSILNYVKKKKSL